MKLRQALIAACIALMPYAALHGEVVGLSWPTRSAAPAPTVDGRAGQLLPAFRLGLSTLPESSIVPLALSQPETLGLSRSQADSLTPLVMKRYELMRASAEFAHAPSLLPYCYSEIRHTTGAALVRIPANASEKSPVVIFLHGQGGSFLWYLHWMSEALPDHIIIAPAYGINPADIPADYLTESRDAASRHLGFPLSKPTLVGLSAGGFGACRAFAGAPGKFGKLICLGAYPPRDTLGRFTRAQSIHFIAGEQEPFVRSGQLAADLERLRTAGPSATLTIIPNADHFFMLSRLDETRQAIRSATRIESKTEPAGITANR